MKHENADQPPPPPRWRRLVPTWLRALILVDEAPSYDAFISYCWASDRDVAPAIQSVIQRFLCPWYKVRSKRVFRDLACLPASSNLGDELRDRLDKSDNLIVLACPEAATSDGMQFEAEYWLSRKRGGHVLVVVTSGDYETWSDIRERALPSALRRHLGSPPIWVDISRHRTAISGWPLNYKIRASLTEDLKQLILTFYPGFDWGQLRGEERTQRRRALMLMWSFSLLLAMSTSVAIWQGILAEQQRDRAVAEALATRATLLAHGPGRLFQTALLVALESLKRDSTAQTDQVVHDIEAKTPVFVEAMRHQGAITSLAFATDGSLLASGSEDGTARIWSVKTGRSEAVFRHPLPVNAVTFAEESSYLITGEGKLAFRGPSTAGALSIWVKGNGWPNQPSYRSVFAHPIDQLGYSHGIVAASDGELMRAWQVVPHVHLIREIGERNSTISLLGTASYVLHNERGNTLMAGQVQGNERTAVLHVPSSSGASIGTIVPIPDGSGFAIAACRDRLEYTCEVEFRSLPRLKTDGARIRSKIEPTKLAISPSGTLVAFVDPLRKGTVEVWDRVSGKRLASVEREDSLNGSLCCILSFSHDSKYLAVSSAEQCLTIYEIDPWREVFRLGAGHDFTAIAWSPDSQMLAAGMRDGRISIWHLVQGGEAWHRNAWDFKYSPGGSFYVTSDVPPGRTMGPRGVPSNQLRATVYDSEGREVVSDINGDYVFSSDDRYIASISEAGDTVNIFDLAAGRALRPIQQLAGDIYNSLSFVKSSLWLFTVAGGRGTLSEWDVKNAKKIKDVAAGRFEDGTISVSADGATWAICPDCRDINSKQPGFDVWNLEHGRITARIPAEAFASAFQISPDGRFAAGFRGGQMTLWETRQGKRLWQDALHGGTSFSIAFSRDGVELASGSGNALKVWETQTGKVLLSVEDQTVGVGAMNNDQSFGFDPTGRYIAAIHKDGTIRIWRLSDGQPVSVVNANGWDHVLFSPDGSTVVTQVRLPALFRAFHWRRLDVLRDGCDHVAWNLTREEWDREVHAGEFRSTCEGKPD